MVFEDFDNDVSPRQQENVQVMRFHEDEPTEGTGEVKKDTLETMKLPSHDVIPEEVSGTVKSSLKMGSQYLKDDNSSFVEFERRRQTLMTNMEGIASVRYPEDEFK